MHRGAGPFLPRIIMSLRGLLIDILSEQRRRKKFSGRTARARSVSFSTLMQRGLNSIHARKIVTRLDGPCLVSICELDVHPLAAPQVLRAGSGTAAFEPPTSATNAADGEANATFRIEIASPVARARHGVGITDAGDAGSGVTGARLTGVTWRMANSTDCGQTSPFRASILRVPSLAQVEAPYETVRTRPIKPGSAPPGDAL